MWFRSQGPCFTFDLLTSRDATLGTREAQPASLNVLGGLQPRGLRDISSRSEFSADKELGCGKQENMSTI